MSAALERDVDKGKSDLVGTYRRFGDIGPVYEIMGTAEEGSVTIRLVESGRLASYPVDEVMQDPAA